MISKSLSLFYNVQLEREADENRAKLMELLHDVEEVEYDDSDMAGSGVLHRTLTVGRSFRQSRSATGSNATTAGSPYGSPLGTSTQSGGGSAARAGRPPRAPETAEEQHARELRQQIKFDRMVTNALKQHKITHVFVRDELGPLPIPQAIAKLEEHLRDLEPLSTGILAQERAWESERARAIKLNRTRSGRRLTRVKINDTPVDEDGDASASGEALGSKVSSPLGASTSRRGTSFDGARRHSRAAVTVSPPAEERPTAPVGFDLEAHRRKLEAQQARRKSLAMTDDDILTGQAINEHISRSRAASLAIPNDGTGGESGSRPNSRLQRVMAEAEREARNQMRRGSEEARRAGVRRRSRNSPQSSTPDVRRKSATPSGASRVTIVEETDAAASGWDHKSPGAAAGATTAAAQSSSGIGRRWFFAQVLGRDAGDQAPMSAAVLAGVKAELAAKVAGAAAATTDGSTGATAPEVEVVVYGEDAGTPGALRPPLSGFVTFAPGTRDPGAAPADLVVSVGGWRFAVTGASDPPSSAPPATASTGLVDGMPKPLGLRLSSPQPGPATDDTESKPAKARQPKAAYIPSSTGRERKARDADAVAAAKKAAASPKKRPKPPPKPRPPQPMLALPAMERQFDAPPKMPSLKPALHAGHRVPPAQGASPRGNHCDGCGAESGDPERPRPGAFVAARFRAFLPAEVAAAATYGPPPPSAATTPRGSRPPTVQTARRPLPSRELFPLGRAALPLASRGSSRGGLASRPDSSGFDKPQVPVGIDEATAAALTHISLTPRPVSERSSARRGW